MHARWILMHPIPEARRAECIGQASNSGKCIDLPSKSKCKFINLSYTTEKQNHLLMFVKNYK